MGTVFIVVAGQHGTNAENYYEMFPAESVLPSPEVLQVDRVIRVSQPSLSSLLQAITGRGDRDIVVVSHGNPTQLAIRVIPGINVGLDIGFINAILGNESNGRLAGRLGTSARNIAIIRRRIQAVQRLGLRRLEFRACRVGASPRTLEALKRLFGATSVSAPNVFDGYGRIRGLTPSANADSIRQWKTANPGHQSFGAAPNRFFWVNNGDNDPPAISSAYAETWAAVIAWAEAKFPSGANHNYSRGTVYYHIQTDMLPGSSEVHGSRTFNSNFVFPNDSQYRQNLIQTGGAAAKQHGSIHRSEPKGRGSIGLNTRYATALDDLDDELVASGRFSKCRVPGPEGLG